jgi:hypothetical protein
MVQIVSYRSGKPQSGYGYLENVPGYLENIPGYLNQSSAIVAFAKTCTIERKITPEYPRSWCVSTPSDMFPDGMRTIGYKMHQRGPSAIVSIIQLVPGALANPTAHTSADTSL